MSPALMLWLDNHAKKNKITKRAVIENALKIYKNDMTKKELKECFKKVAQDVEIIKMAEEGLEDYNDQLKRINA
jgi:hypothetical protein